MYFLLAFIPDPFFFVGRGEREEERKEKTEQRPGLDGHLMTDMQSELSEHEKLNITSVEVLSTKHLRPKFTSS